MSTASEYVRSADYEGAHTMLVSLEPMVPRDPAFQRGAADEPIRAL